MGFGFGVGFSVQDGDSWCLIGGLGVGGTRRERPEIPCAALAKRLSLGFAAMHLPTSLARPLGVIGWVYGLGFDGSGAKDCALTSSCATVLVFGCGLVRGC